MRYHIKVMPCNIKKKSVLQVLSVIKFNSKIFGDRYNHITNIRIIAAYLYFIEYCI